MNNWQTSSIRRPKCLFWAALLLLTILAAAGSLWLGSVAISPAEVFSALLGQGGNSTAAKIVLFSRLPRTLAALLSGAALAVSGAGLAVALLCAAAPAAQRFSAVAAFIGALLSVLLVLGLSERTGASRITLVLAGVAISNLFSAGIDTVVTFVPDALSGVSDFRIGGFHGVTMARLTLPAVLIAVSLLAVCSLSQQLDVLALGSDTARSLGLPVGSVRFLLLVLAAALSGAAVSFSGLLGFVGLIVPHAMRRLVGADSFPLLVASALGGACFVTICDLLARVLFAPFELPVGVVLAFAGVPFFLWLLFRQRGGRT